MAKQNKLKKIQEKSSEFIHKILNDTKNLPALLDSAILFGCGLAGYEATKDYKGALAGMVSYKLATTEGTISQGAGLIGLTIIGMAFTTKGVTPAIEGVPGVLDGYWEKKTGLTCEEGYHLEWDLVNGWNCIEDRQPT